LPLPGGQRVDEGEDVGLYVRRTQGRNVVAGRRALTDVERELLRFLQETHLVFGAARRQVLGHVLGEVEAPLLGVPDEPLDEGLSPRLLEGVDLPRLLDGREQPLAGAELLADEEQVGAGRGVLQVLDDDGLLGRVPGV
jgi:hypothetical protein